MRKLMRMAPLVLALDATGQTIGVPPLAGRPVLLAVTLNGWPADVDTIFLQDDEEHLHAPAEFLQTWNLPPSDAPRTSADGTTYVDLTSIQGLSYAWDHATGELAIYIGAEAFVPTRINVGAEAPATVASYTPGGYLKYDLSLSRGPGVHANQAWIDMGVFRGEGLLTSSFSTGASGSSSGLRLMTTYRRDRIASITTLRVGDSYNTTGAWGRGVLFGGIQYGTNFAVRPDFVPAAMPSVSGKALLPSTVDVYVNNALRTRQKVNTGPFSIHNLPLITGAGNVQVVVRDLLGREQRITQSFFTSPTLLREGLVDDSYELGWMRQNFGGESNAYSDPFAAITYRKGLASRWTGEMRAEVQKGVTTAGLSTALTWPALRSVLESSLATSRARTLTRGWLGSLRYSYLGAQWSFNARWQWANLAFRQIGSDLDRLPRQTASAQVSAPLGDGTLSVNYLRQQDHGQALTRLLNISYGHRLTDQVQGSLILLRSFAPGASTTAAVAMTVLLDAEHFGSATLNQGAGAPTLYAEYQRATPRAEGIGWRLAAQAGESARQEASVTRNMTASAVEAQAVRLEGAVSTRISARGGMALLASEMYFARALDDSFAVVQIGQVAGIPIQLNNQVVAHTNARGRAVVGNLNAYLENRISIDPLALRMDLSMGAVEKIVVPRSQGGVLVEFDVRPVRHATLTLVWPAGLPLPPWTPVEVVGVAQVFVMGNRGEVAVELPGLKGNRVIARPTGLPPCSVLLDLADAGTTPQILGPLTCLPAG